MILSLTPGYFEASGVYIPLKSIGYFKSSLSL